MAAASPTGTDTATTPSPMMIEFHKPSIMAHIARILPGEVRLSLRSEHLPFVHNELLSNFVTYLKVSSASDIAWEFNSKFPSMVKISNKIYNSASTFDGFSFDIYSQGMDFLLENFFFSPDEGSQYVNDLLDKISKDLKIKEAKKTIPEMLLHTGFAGFENFHSLDREHLSKLLQESFTQLEQESML